MRLRDVVANECRRDRDWAWRHLAERHPVGKLARRHPGALSDHLPLNERDDHQPAAIDERPDLQKEESERPEDPEVDRQQRRTPPLNRRDQQRQRPCRHERRDDRQPCQGRGEAPGEQSPLPRPLRAALRQSLARHQDQRDHRGVEAEKPRVEIPVGAITKVGPRGDHQQREGGQQEADSGDDAARPSRLQVADPNPQLGARRAGEQVGQPEPLEKASAVEPAPPVNALLLHHRDHRLRAAKAGAAEPEEIGGDRPQRRRRGAMIVSGSHGDRRVASPVRAGIPGRSGCRPSS